MQLQADQVYAQLDTIIFGAVDGYGVDWSLESLDGWGATRPSIDVTPRTRASGGWAGASYDQPRTLALGGKIFAPTAQLLQQAIDRLDAAVSNTTVVLSVVEAGLVRTVNVRKSDQVLVNWLMPTIAEWSIQVVAVDPRKFGTPLTGTTMLPATSGGVTFPLTFPFAFSETVISGQIALTNPGNTTGPVLLRIDGPATGPQIAHAGQTGGVITFSSSLVLGAGEYLLIDMDRRTALANGQSPRTQYITSAGWSGFDPGVNTWSLTSAVYNAGTQLTVTATPAWK